MVRIHGGWLFAYELKAMLLIERHADAVLLKDLNAEWPVYLVGIAKQPAANAAPLIGRVNKESHNASAEQADETDQPILVPCTPAFPSGSYTGCG